VIRGGRGRELDRAAAARVYLRASCWRSPAELKLDGERVWRDYEQRWRAANGGETV